MIKKTLAVLLALSLGSVGHQHLTVVQERFKRAENGDSDAQLQLAKSYWQQDTKTSAYYWWERAAKNGNVESINLLMEYFPQQSDKWQALAAKAGIASAIDEVAKRELAGSKISLETWVTRWQQEQTLWLEDQKNLLKRFKETPHCQSTLAVIGYSHAQKADYLRVLSALEESSFELNWCSRWVVDPSLNCEVKGERQRADCHAETDADYQIILAKTGIASASGHQIVLTEHSSKAVIQHEVAHWLGLADEYSMSGSLAKSFCQGLYEHPSLNVVVTQMKTKISEKEIKSLYERIPWKKSLNSWRDIAQYNGQYWVLGSDAKQHQVGLFKAETCNSQENFQAWKPVKETTAMEQHSTEYWPEVYLDLIKN